MPYKDKIRLVCKILQREVEVKESRGSNFSMVLEEGTTERVSLPPAEGFARVFREWQEELQGKPGSTRAKSRPNEPYEVGTFPTKPHTKSAYDGGDETWRRQAPLNNGCLLESELYRGRSEPSPHVSASRLRSLESELRDNITILSHMDWFVAAAKKEAQNQVTALETRERPVDDEAGHEADQEVWNGCQNITELLDSVGRGIQDITKTLIHATGYCTLIRRDAWLDRMENISKESVLKLRCGDINAPKLFEDEALKEVAEECGARRMSRMQDSILKSRPRDNRPGEGRKTSSRGSDKRPFRRRVDYNGSNSNNAPASNFQHPKPGGSGRGGRGRGRKTFNRN
jgi:hypothetical protein